MEFHKLKIKEIRNLLTKGEFSSYDLCKFFIDRINKIDPRLKACISVFEKEALEQALLADEMIKEGKDLPLLGIPYLAKDNILTKGFKTTASSKMLEDYIAPYDATVIEKLKNAGAILLGKTNLDEFAHGASTENSAFFPTRNPWDLERVPGGSSGGSAAAVAASLCVFALGSDTGGSIRQPASFCGVTGFKPSYSRVSRYGLISMTSSTDVIGPITRNVEDAALVMEVISGCDKKDPSSSDLKIDNYSDKINERPKNLKIGVVRDFIEKLDSNMKLKMEESISILKSMGFKIKDINLPYNKYSGPVYYVITPSELSSNLARFDGIRYGFSSDLKLKGNSSDNLNELYLKNRGGGFGQEVKRRIVLGTYALSSGYFDAYYKKAMAVRSLIKKEFNESFKDVDLILTPTTPHIAFKLLEKKSDPLSMYLEDIFVTGPSLAGLPAVSVPAGFLSNMPVGIQFFANNFQENRVLAVAKMFQDETGFYQEFPNIN